MSRVEIYTDGSALGNPGPGGCAFVVVQNNAVIHKQNHYLGKNITNNQAELTAFMLALVWIQESNTPDVLIYSDSKYVVDGSSKWIINWKKKDFNGVKNDDMWRTASKLIDVVPHSIEWVKAHNGNTWNELADDLARDAAGNKKLVDKL